MRGLVLFLAWVGVAIVGGCAQIRVTDPPRSATEQFLISTAAAEAVAQIATEPLRDRVVYVDTTYLIRAAANVAVGGAYELHYLDRDFMIAEVRSHLLLHGIRLAHTRDEADIVLEVRSGGLGIDREDYLLGIPPVLIPASNVDVTDTGEATIITPEIAFLKNIKQQGFASVAYVAYWRDSGEVVGSSGPFVGRTFRSDWWYFGVGPRTSGDVEPAAAQNDQ